MKDADGNSLETREQFTLSSNRAGASASPATYRAFGAVRAPDRRGYARAGEVTHGYARAGCLLAGRVCWRQAPCNAGAESSSPDFASEGRRNWPAGWLPSRRRLSAGRPAGVMFPGGRVSTPCCRLRSHALAGSSPPRCARCCACCIPAEGGRSGLDLNRFRLQSGLEAVRAKEQ
jgi:hypothetical protein